MKEKQKTRSGISLIVLIITIIVVIILAAAVILTLTKNNPITKANEASFKNDLKSLAQKAHIGVLTESIDDPNVIKKTITGEDLNKYFTTEEIAKYKFYIEEGELTIKRTDYTEEEIKWAIEIGIRIRIGEATPPGGNIYTDSEGNKAPIPNGFVVSTVPGENTVNGGLVIKEGTDGASTTSNEFVWVPVPDITEMYDEATKRGKLYDFSANRVSTMKSDCLTTTDGYIEPDVVGYDGTSEDTVGITKVMLQNEFDAMITSVKKYKGFYIGRYETGDVSKSTVVVKKGNADIGYYTWYTKYSKSKEMISNSYVQTGIIWGSQWDATLRYMNRYEDTGNYVTDSTGKGNYKNETFTYVDKDGSTKTKVANVSTRIPTGSADISKVKNIYDMAGNVHEWTMEANSSSDRVLRGADFSNIGSNFPAYGRYYNDPRSSFDHYGSRISLYIK